MPLRFYVYGDPLVYDLKAVASFVEGGGSLPMQAPYNSFASARRLLGPETRFVSPNNDTLYVGGQCDVRQGPLVLQSPTHTTATRSATGPRACRPAGTAR